jgi:hypothetical protein
MPRDQCDGSLWRYSRFSRPEPLLFLPNSSSVVLMLLSGPRSRPTTSQKFCSARNRARTSRSVVGNSNHYITKAVGKPKNSVKPSRDHAVYRSRVLKGSVCKLESKEAIETRGWLKTVRDPLCFQVHRPAQG